MVRFKNAITGYFIAPIPTGNAEPTYVELADYITTVTDDSDETVEAIGYYSGDGTAEDEVITVKKSYGFEGYFDAADAAMSLVAGLELKIGEDRKLLFKQVRTDGSSLTGEATVSNIKVTGGEATEYAPFNCTISWNRTPTVTPAPIPPNDDDDLDG